jgi:exodeoxyribonuclease V gamma subunit
LIDDFAQQANKAAFDAPVPAEVVRAHFTAALGDADTRAPLLTGGVSVARMVPMRLLPFRVICLLGMNDGDFPRRDPAAGLSKLAAEIAGGKRLPGDRSTREDDRFLFLQLFTAAQEVFYLSWLGADPRDGSRREPSVLVTELLAAAAAQHAAIETDAETDAETAPIEEQLVLRHPLQPFAQAAFGAHDNAGNPDTRVFSYDAHWQPAAGSVSAARQPLPPWLAADASLAPQEGGTALDATPDAEPTLALDTLRRFLQDPAKQFLRERMQLRLPELEARTADLEPLQAPAAGLQRSVLQRAVFEQLLTSDNSDAHLALLRARGLLPSGPLGRRVLQDMTREIAPYAKAYTQWRGDAQPATLPLSVMIDGVRVHGRLAEVLPGGVTRLRFGKPSGRSAIRNGLDWLLLCAAGQDTPFMEFHDNGSGGLGPHPRPALPQADAIAALRRLLALHRDGLRQPLPFAPYSSWKLFNAKTTDNGVRDAANQWRGNFRGWAEGQSEALRLALRGRDPFANLEALREFARIAGVVFGTLNTGTPTLFQIDASMLPAAFDRDDEEGEYDGGEDAA